jgi:hypothetical protein
MKLDQEFINRVKEPIYDVWQTIGPDADEFTEDNLEAIEACIDAGRLITEAEDKEAHDIIGELVAEHGYIKVLRFLGKHIHLK